MDKFANIGWAEMLLMALIGFLIVFMVLVLLIGIMKAMGYFFTAQNKKAKAVAASGAVAEADDHAISDAEIVAAIAVALKLYKSDLHDRESEVLTINRITRVYSPWNSKIHGLTELPKHK